jgi:TPR repeat protein
MDDLFQRWRKTAAEVGGLAAVQLLADQGDAQAQLSLGLRYGNAAGDKQDYLQAARWYRKAADQDCPLAQFNLGVMFARGQGVAPDPVTSADWLRKAAEGGDPGGQHELGLLCYRASLDARRVDREESRLEAYKWLHLATEQGYKNASTVWELVTMSMTRADIAEGNRRSAAFVPRRTANSIVP